MTTTATRAALDVDTLADLHDAIDRIGLLRIERHLDCADPRAEDTARANLDAAISAHVAAEVARALEAAPDVEEAIVKLASSEVIADRPGESADVVAAELEACAARTALRAAIAADRARAVAEACSVKSAACPQMIEWQKARPTPDEARRMVDAFGAVVDRIAGFADDPPANRDHYNTQMDRLIADHKAARDAILRALGVES